MTQQEIDQAYSEWREAALQSPVGGTPAVEALWQRFARMDKELNGVIGKSYAKGRGGQ